jgi:hypothetical protein
MVEGLLQPGLLAMGNLLQVLKNIRLRESFAQCRGPQEKVIQITSYKPQITAIKASDPQPNSMYILTGRTNQLAGL